MVSSLAFGILHGERWLAGTLAGIVYAGVYLRRGSIGDATAAHATTNALIAAAVLGAGQWHLWWRSTRPPWSGHYGRADL